MNWNRWIALPLAGWLLAALIVTSCSRDPHSDKPSGKVVAKVTYGGKPVTSGILNLSDSRTGLGGGGEITSDGTVTIASVVVGDYVVTVSPPILMGGDPNPKPVEHPDLPKKFRSEQTSPLKATVKKGTNEFTFDLKE